MGEIIYIIFFLCSTNSELTIFKKMKEIEEEKFKIWHYVIVSLIIVVVLWVGNLVMLVSSSDRGAFGDMFGAVNSLFTGLAFAGVIITILLQRHELELQRKELKSTREEFKIQNRTLKVQRFENTFFQMLSLHHQIVDSMDDIEKKKLSRRQIGDPIEYKDIPIKGRDVFKIRYKDLSTNLRVDTLDLIENNYISYYEEYVNTNLGHYFRNLYRIIKIIDKNELFTKDLYENDDKIFLEKYKYTSIIRAQLSDFEVLWLFYNCLSTNGNQKFKPLVEKFTIFKNLPQDKLVKKDHIQFYNESAFNIEKNEMYKNAMAWNS